jgi:hypothetical protein
MVSCKGCGLDIDEAMLFCPYCGRKKEAAAEKKEAPGPLRAIPCRIGWGEDWRPAAMLVEGLSISFLDLPEHRPKETVLTIFQPSAGYLPGGADVNAAEASGRRAETVIEVEEIDRADLSYLQIDQEELYVLKLTLKDGRSIGVRLPMDRVYRDLLMSVLGNRLRW